MEFFKHQMAVAAEITQDHVTATGHTRLTHPPAVEIDTLMAAPTLHINDVVRILTLTY